MSTRATISTVLEFLKELPPSADDVPFDDVLSLMHHANTHFKQTVRGLNWGPSKYDQQLQKRTEDGLRRLATQLGCPGVAFEGDPRGGYTVKLLLPSGRSNSFDGEGWIIPHEVY